MVTLYDTLGVREDATDEEIKRAYRKAAMKSHPDRNVGREASAHSTFQQIKEAYAILSDPAQRRVYDAVFAEEMHRLRCREEEERLHAERETSEQDAQYAALVTLAMRFAERGHNRDIVFGVLLGRDCDALLAARIADSVAALYSSHAAPRARPEAEPQAEPEPEPKSEPGSSAEPQSTTERAHAGLFSTLWHGVFGLRS
jgi:curved DNA-binding protein CbpA